MKVILAEKPSVARAIADVLGATKKCDGYLEGNGYQVTWAFGHLAELVPPETYNPAWKKWDLNALPMIPSPFQLAAKNDEGAKKQLAVIENLFASTSEIICATDAGREGELIYRYIIRLAANNNKAVTKRLWISSLTNEVIKTGFDHLKNGGEFDNLYHAAQCRSEADWIVGLNATRAYTCKFSAVSTLSIGRVQTPVLALVVQRDAEILNFKSRPFFEVISAYKGIDFKYEGGRFDDKPAAERLLKKITGSALIVTDVAGKSEKVQSPLLYDLTDLQKDLNVRFGFTADKTLALVQSLYEAQYVTYPRTDSRYLSSDMANEMPALLEKLAIQFKEASAFPNIDSRFFNDAKVTDHHAIIPTPKLPSSLKGDEQKVYDAIVMRFIAASYPPCIKQVTTVLAAVNGECFKATGTMIESQGWQSLYKEVEEQAEKALPLFVKNESGSQTPRISQGKTTPPKPYTEATLLGIMETAGKICEEESLKEALKERGLGTPATRASILEGLKKRGYIEAKGKSLISTTTGQQLIGLIQCDKLKSPELTGEWELKLKRIEKGDYPPDVFMSEIVQFSHEIINEVKSSQAAFDKGLGLCPLCQKAVVETGKGYGCSGWRDGCQFVVWKTIAGKKITPSVVSELLKSGRTKKLEGFISPKTKEKFSAALAIKSDATGITKVTFEF